MVEAGVIPPDARIEVIGGEIVPMSPKGARHEAIKVALARYWGKRSPDYYVVAQETGFSSWLPTGAGLLSFRTAAEAASALDEVVGDYERHRRAARTLAQDVFDSDRVLGELLECL